MVKIKDIAQSWEKIGSQLKEAKRFMETIAKLKEEVALF